MGGEINGIKSANIATEKDYYDDNFSVLQETKPTSSNDIFNFSATGFQERTGVDQGGLFKAKLNLVNAKATTQIPRMDARSEAELSKLNPELANRIRQTAATLKAQGINVVVAPKGGFRSFAEQNALYAQGRNGDTRDRVTNAKGGESYHNYGLAVDLVPTDSKGNPTWSAPDKTWKAIGAAGKQAGLEWGGDWKSFKDLPHLQMAGTTKHASDLLQAFNKGGLKAVWEQINKSYPQTTTPTAPPTPATPPTTKPPTSLPVPTARLEKGAHGEQVKQLQNALVKLGYMTQAQMNTGPGTFGPRTDAALRSFQRSHNLVPDGIYGPKTQAALTKALGGNVKPPTTTPTTPTTPANPANTTAQGKNIDKILRGTGLEGKGEVIARLAKKYNVPPEFAIAMFRKEASFAQNGTLADRNNNPGNIRFAKQEGAVNGASGFAKWKTMDEGIEAFFKLMNKQPYRGFVDNKDYTSLINRYAPPSENDSQKYIADIKGWIEGYRQKINA